MNSEVFEALNLLEKERGIPVDFMLDKIKKAIVTACKNSYGNEDAVINMDAARGQFDVYLRKEVAEEVTNTGKEISVEKAREIDPAAAPGDKVSVLLNTKDFGRIAAQTARYRDHVIVCGAGELGLSVSEILRHAGVAHLLLEADAQKVEAARAAGAPVFHGDASRPDTLLAAGLTHAHMVVLTFAHAQQALRIAQAIAERRPALTLWVSCRITTAADAFRAMPNVRVYQQSFAAAIGLAEQVMSTLGMSTELIEGHISAMRRRLDSSRFPGSSSS